jgi:hypothetical protein
MECEMCGQEVANSEELQKHRERMHPYPSDEGATKAEGESPAFMTPESEPEPIEAPEPAHERR